MLKHAPTRTPLLILFGICMLAILLPARSAAQTTASAIQIIDVAHEPGGPMTVTFQASNSSLESLQLLVDGKPAPYTLAANAAPGARLVLAIDNSASMTSAQRAQIQDAALSLIDALGAGTEVAVVAFGGGTGIAQPFTTDNNTLASTIAGLTTIGGAALYSGVETAAGLAAASNSETLIVLFTYGWDWGGLSTTTRETSLAAIQASGAPVYVQSTVLYGEDVAYLSTLPTDGTIHSLTELYSLPNAANLLEGNGIAQHTLQIDRATLTLGEHTLRLAIDEGSATTTIRDEGLITLATAESVSDGQPIQVTISLNDELAGTTLVASSEGTLLPIGDDGALSVDPWQFSPGDTSLQIRAQVDERTIATASTSISVPSLQPVISTDTASDPSRLVATVLAQPGTASTLVAISHGEVIATASAPSLQLEVPPDGQLTIEARADDGAVLASVAVTTEAAPQSIPQDTGTGAPSALIIAGLLSLGVTAALVVFWRRRSRPAPRSIPWKTTDITPTASPPPPVHTPVRLHPVGNRTIVVTHPGLEQQHLTLGPGAIAIGASPLCDITVDGLDVRFVHAVIGPDGPELRIHRFGPVTMDDRPLQVEDSVLSTGTTLAIGDTLITVGSQEQIDDGAAAA